MNIKMKINVDKINFNINKKEIHGDKFNISPRLTKRTIILDEEKGIFVLELGCFILNDETNKTPFNLEIIVSGIFELNTNNKDSIEQFQEIQGVQIVFPYLRALVSNVTSIAMVPTINIPIINPLDFKEEQ